MTAESLPPLVGGRYRPIRLLGQGGMGAVYVVEHVHTGEQLALKVLLAQAGASTDHIERFKREARASARIKSENVVRVTDSDVAAELQGAPFLVMELLEGRDLDAISEGQPQAPATAIEWLRQIAHGLEKAHALGLVHRDLKPENLFLTRREDGSPLVKILDFGLVKMVEEAGGKTQSGEILGTPRYMAPEQARGDVNEIGPATDRWSLALVAYKLLTGVDYWDAKTVHHLLAQIVYEPIVPPSARGVTLGPAFDRWFLHACSRDPKQRFNSSGEQIEALAEALGLPPRALYRASDSGDGAMPSGRPYSGGSGAMARSQDATILAPKKTNPALLAALGVGVLLIGAGATFLYMRPGSPPPVAAIPAASSAPVAVAAPPIVAPVPTVTASTPVVEPVVDPSKKATSPVAAKTHPGPKPPKPPTGPTSNGLDEQK